MVEEQDVSAGRLPKFVSDAPPAVDAFGSHQKIAEALSEVFREDHEGCCIALEGSWGSGKSSVINFLEQILQDGTQLFVFDAWANQGDPLRLTFLAKLIDWKKRWLIKKGSRRGDIDDINTLDDELSHAQRKLETQNKNVKSQQSDSSVVAGFAFRLFVSLPIGLAIISSILSDYSGIAHLGTPNAWFILILVVVGACMVLEPVRFLHFTKLNALNVVADALLQRTEEHDVITHKWQRKPVSLEFEDILRRFVARWYAASESGNLIIVFDNIDRVSHENSARMWSLLTSLLDVVHRDRNVTGRNVWVLVPVDTTTIPIPVFEARSEERPVAGSIEEQQNIRNNFVNKTFQILVNVPPPIASDLEAYFSQIFSQAFIGTIDEREGDKIFNIFRSETMARGSFTPRDVKRFVNDLVALRRVRARVDTKENIPLSVVAAFVCSRHRVGKPYFEIPSLKFLSGLTRQHCEADDEDTVSSYSAITFGVPKERGTEVLIQGAVGAAISHGSIEPLERFLDLPAFPEAFIDYVRRHDFVGTQSATMALIVTFISSFPRDVADQCFDRIRPLLKRFVDSVNLTQAVSISVGRGAFIAGFQAYGSAFDATACSSRAMNSITKKKESESVTKELVAFLIGWVEGAKLVGWRDKVVVDLIGLESFSNEILKSFNRTSPESDLLSFVISDESNSSAFDQVIGSVSAGNSTDAIVSLFGWLNVTSKKAGELLKAIGARLSGAVTESATQFEFQIGVALAILRQATEGSESRIEAVRQWFDTGWVFHQLQVTGSAAFLSGALLVLGREVNFRNDKVPAWNQSIPGFSSWKNHISSLVGEDLDQLSLDRSANDLIYYTLELAKDYGLTDLRNSLIEHLNTGFEERVDVACFEMLADEHLASIKPDLMNQVVQSAVDYLNIDEKIAASDIAITSDVVFLSIFQALSNDDRRKKFANHAEERFGERDEAWWGQLIETSRQELFMIGDMFDSVGVSQWLPDKARPCATRWISQLDPDKQTSEMALAKRLLAALSASERSNALFQLYSDAVRDPMPAQLARCLAFADYFSAKGEDAVRPVDFGRGIVLKALEEYGDQFTGKIVGVDKETALLKWIKDQKLVSSIRALLVPQEPAETESKEE